MFLCTAFAFLLLIETAVQLLTQQAATSHPLIIVRPESENSVCTRRGSHTVNDIDLLSELG